MTTSDSKRLTSGIYAHLIVNRKDDVKRVLSKAGIALPSDSVYGVSQATSAAIRNQNPVVMDGIKAIVSDELRKQSKYSSYAWLATLFGALGSSGGSGSQSGTTGSSGGGGSVGVGGGITSTIMGALVAMFKGNDAELAQTNAQTIAQIAAMQAEKTKAQNRMILYVMLGVAAISGTIIYFITRKK